MPLFHFHLLTPEGVERDVDGLTFPDLDAAYLQAYATVPELTQELLGAGRDPLSCTFLITDADGRRLLEVPFRERVRGARRPSRPPVLTPAAYTASERAQQLLDASRRERALLRDNLDRMRALLVDLADEPTRGAILD